MIDYRTAIIDWIAKAEAARAFKDYDLSYKCAYTAVQWTNLLCFNLFPDIIYPRKSKHLHKLRHALEDYAATMHPSRKKQIRSGNELQKVMGLLKLSI